MHKEESKITCPIFRRQELLIRSLTSTINRVKAAQEKARYAEGLQKEVVVLLNCQDYKKENLDCKNCHFIAHLRRKTANLVMKAKKLSEA